jgi:hypothetical protein
LKHPAASASAWQVTRDAALSTGRPRGFEFATGVRPAWLGILLTAEISPLPRDGGNRDFGRYVESSSACDHFESTRILGNNLKDSGYKVKDKKFGGSHANPPPRA